MKVIGVYEIMPWCNGLDRNVRQCLNDYAIPLYLSTTVTKIHGYNRVEAITVNRVDKNGEILPNTEERISCDTLLLSVGLIPENELSRRAGAKLSPITKGPLVNDRLMTTVPGIFSCGNVLHIHDVADFAAEEGFKAGERAANYTAEEKKNDEETIGIHVGKNIRYCLPQRISKGITGIDISFRVSIPLNNQTLIIRDMKNGEELFHKQYVRILPSELEKITLKQPVNHELEVFCHEC